MTDSTDTNPTTTAKEAPMPKQNKGKRKSAAKSDTNTNTPEVPMSDTPMTDTPMTDTDTPEVPMSDTPAATEVPMSDTPAATEPATEPAGTTKRKRGPNKPWTVKDHLSPAYIELARTIGESDADTERKIEACFIVRGLPADAVTKGEDGKPRDCIGRPAATTEKQRKCFDYVRQTLTTRFEPSANHAASLMGMSSIAASRYVNHFKALLTVAGLWPKTIKRDGAVSADVVASAAKRVASILNPAD